MKSFWKSRNLFSKRFLAAGGKSDGGFWRNKKKGARQIYEWARFLSRCPIFPEIFPLILRGTGKFYINIRAVELGDIRILMGYPYIVYT
jgi:hypothetical protein